MEEFRYSRDTCALPLALELLQQQIPGISHCEKEEAWSLPLKRGEFASQKEISHCFDKLSHHLEGEAGAETVADGATL